MTYTLHHAPLGYLQDNPDAWTTDDAHGKLHSTHETLTDAMAAAGHARPEDWHTATRIHDKVYLDWTLYFDAGLRQFIAEGRGTADDYEDYDEHGRLIYLEPRWTIIGPGAADEFNAMVGLPGVAPLGWGRKSPR